MCIIWIEKIGDSNDDYIGNLTQSCVKTNGPRTEL